MPTKGDELDIVRAHSAGIGIGEEVQTPWVIAEDLHDKWNRDHAIRARISMHIGASGSKFGEAAD